MTNELSEVKIKVGERKHMSEKNDERKHMIENKE